MSTNSTPPSESDYIRAFIAISINSESKLQLCRAQEELRRLDAGVKWVAPEIMHLTIAFLGDIPTEKVATVAKVMDGVGAATRAIPCSITGLGFFGSRSSPRIIWAGIYAGQALQILHSALCAEIRRLHISLDDRPFKPHLTLGRAKSISNIPAFMKKLESHAATPFGEMQIDSLHLIRSNLTSHGPEYSILHRTCLDLTDIA